MKGNNPDNPDKGDELDSMPNQDFTSSYQEHISKNYCQDARTKTDTQSSIENALKAAITEKKLNPSSKDRKAQKILFPK